jgi:Cd2+/Zn2+-exporting ATPase
VAEPPAFTVGRSFKVRGMDCAEEVTVLKGALGELVGGESNLAFDVLNARMMISAAATADDAAIMAAVADTGMQATPWQKGARDADADSHRRQQVIFTAASGAFLAVGIVLHLILAPDLLAGLRMLVSHEAEVTPWPEMAAYIAAALLGARFVVIKAWYAARNLRPDINLLMVVAVIGAAAIGQWFEAATVAFLFALSLALEGWSVGRARRAIAALLNLAPATVRKLRSDGSDIEVPVAEVKPGEQFVVPGGERIALDGRVVDGASAVNQSPITGESVPVEKDVGSEVYAGTINGDGTLVVAATKAAEDTTLARIIRMVEEAHARRAPTEQWVEKFARIYTPAVMALALLVFVVPPLLFGGLWVDWLYRALVLLVIACPCALVISTPVSIVASLAASARAGVLVKGGAYIELPARLKAIAMDKTGTITRGEPAVVRVIPLGDHSEAELLERAAALEARSTHPLARAVLREAAARGIAATPAEDVEMLKGRGLTGMVKGEPFWLGSHRYAVERDQDTPETVRQAEALEADGKTVLVVGNGRHVCGLIAVADTIRPEAKAIVAALHKAGIEQVIMLTGDNRVTAEAIAREVGIDAVHAELLPEDKVREIERLVATHTYVAMVGDGVNDAPALARASMGIAMGAIGSDAAIETADVALMTDDISHLPWLIRHATRTLTVIRQNIIFSLGVKAVFLILTFAGMASLWGAIAADVGASLLVVFNALRLLNGKAKRAVTVAPAVAAAPGAARRVVPGNAPVA